MGRSTPLAMPRDRRYMAPAVAVCVCARACVCVHARAHSFIPKGSLPRIGKLARSVEMAFKLSKKWGGKGFHQPTSQNRCRHE
eukprot:scaffold20935_cov18-Tisochrysis_lutea.AAC.3